MDSKVEELFNGVTVMSSRMSSICSLAIELNLPDDICNTLQSANTSLADCKGLIEFHMNQNSYNITSVPKKDEVFDDIAGSVKCEELNIENKNFISEDSLTINKLPEFDNVSMDTLETKVEICEIPDLLKFDEEIYISHTKDIKTEDNFVTKDDFQDSIKKKNSRQSPDRTKNKSKKLVVAKVFKKKCWNCFKSYPENDYKNHTEECRPKKVICSVCGKVLSGRVALNFHMNMHINPKKNFSCDVCDKKYRTERELKNHQQLSHFDLRTCDICGAQIKGGKGALKDHIKTHEENRKRPYACESCDKSFYTKPLLKAHFSIHSDEKLFSCNSCGKSFNRRRHLDQHSKAHSEERTYSCSVCSKSYKFPSSLQKHIRGHH